MARLNSWSVYESTWYVWSVHVCLILLCSYAAGLKRAICFRLSLSLSLFPSLSFSLIIIIIIKSCDAYICRTHHAHIYTHVSADGVQISWEWERVIRVGKLYKFYTLSVLYRRVFVQTMSSSFCSICASTRRFSYIWFFRAFSRIQITLSVLFQVVTSSVHAVMSSEND